MQDLAIIIVGILFILLLWLVVYLPIMGFAYILLGEWALGVLYLTPLICTIGVLLYRQFVICPERKRMIELSRMHHYPRRLTKNESSDQWSKGFKAVIHGGLVSVTDPSKQKDLHQCQKIVEKMSKDNAFENLHRAFRLTGCHLEIKDSTDHTITQIV